MTTIGKALNELETDKFLRISKINPSGTLEARKLSAGAIAFYWRTTFNGKTARHRVGTYDSSAPPKSLAPTSKGFSIAAAARRAEEFASQHDLNLEHGGFSAVKAAKKLAAASEAETALQAKEFTLSKLLDAYCDHQKALGRSSHKNAQGIFDLHIKSAFPAVASQPANTVSMEQFVAMMRRLQEAGKGRTSNKLRSYARAAYALALRAKADAAVPGKFLGFGVNHNPLSDTFVDAASNKADKNPLQPEQMRVYWRAIKDLPGLPGQVLRLHLLTGAQRIEQFVRLRTSEIHEDHILLWDGKGKPGKAPRAHPVPILPEARIALEGCNPTGEYAMSGNEGKTHISNTTLSKWAQAAVGDLLPQFQAKQLRSGVETMLAANKIEKETRGRLQSHGISGVQDVHYNGYEYLDEKLAALELLYKLISK